MKVKRSLLFLKNDFVCYATSFQQIVSSYLMKLNFF